MRFLLAFILPVALWGESISIDWEDVPIGTAVTDAAIPAAGYGTWESHGTGEAGDTFTHDIQEPPWGGKALRIVQGTVQRSLAGTMSFTFSSANKDVLLTARCATADRIAVNMHWDGGISNLYPPHVENGYTLQTRPSVQENRITRWLNHNLWPIKTISYVMDDNNDFRMKCLIKPSGDLYMWVDDEPESLVHVTENTHKSGGFAFFCYALSNSFVDDIVVREIDAGSLQLPGWKKCKEFDFFQLF